MSDARTRDEIIAALKRAFPCDPPPWGLPPDEDLMPHVVFTAEDGGRSIRSATFGEIADALRGDTDE